MFEAVSSLRVTTKNEVPANLFSLTVHILLYLSANPLPLCDISTVPTLPPVILMIYNVFTNNKI